MHPCRSIRCSVLLGLGSSSRSGGDFACDLQFVHGVAGDVPHVAGETSSHGDRDGLGVLAAYHHLAVAMAQVLLGRPGSLPGVGRGQSRLALQMLRLAGREPVGPGAFHQQAPQDGVARLGDASGSSQAAAAALAWRQAQIGHERARGGEASQVAHLGQQGHRGDPVDASQRAQLVDELLQGRLVHFACEIALGVPKPSLQILQHVEMAAQGLLRRRSLQLEILEPGPIRLAPGRSSLRRLQVPAQREVADSPPRSAYLILQHHAAPNQIAHRLLCRIRHPDRRQKPCQAQPSQLASIAPIRLHSVAAASRNQRRSRNHAGQTHVAQLAMQREAAGPRLVSEVKGLAVVPRQPPHAAGNLTRPIRDDSDVLHSQLSRDRHVPRDSHRNRVLVDVKANVDGSTLSRCNIHTTCSP